MSLQTFTRVSSYIKSITLSIIGLSLVSQSALADWKLDFSRRQKDIRRHEKYAPVIKNKDNFFGKLFSAEAPANDVVILNTEKGFVPKTVRLRKDTNYRVHIVNVNKSDRNTSFIMDAFSQHHSTFYGDIKSFDVKPQKEGVFSFQCPETSLEGKVVVFQPEIPMMRRGKQAMRLPASE